MSSDPQVKPELAYYSERYSGACSKMVDKIMTEFDYKNLAKYFATKSLSRYDEERFKSICKQFVDYFKKALMDEIEKVNKKHNVHPILSDVFEMRQRKNILGTINSSELKRDSADYESVADLEKMVYECIKEQLNSLKSKNIS